MEATDEDDDLKLVKASAGLLLDLESALPKILWKPRKNGSSRGRVHSQVRKRDLYYVIELVRDSLIVADDGTGSHGVSD